MTEFIISLICVPAKKINFSNHKRWQIIKDQPNLFTCTLGYMNFSLEKTYFDCIDEEGNCFIIYWAKLKFSVIRLTYSALIYSDSEGNTFEKSSLKNIRKPINENLIVFRNKALKFEGEWQKMDDSVSLLLYKDPFGKELFWDCHHPKAFTRIVYNNKNFKGLGYAETLNLPIKPWHLPIDELRWGRFLSEKVTIIWINWKGSHPVNKIICCGRIYEDAVFSELSVSFNNGTSVIKFLEKTVIRTGKLSNVLTRMPWLKVIFNKKILNTNETKYKAKSSFTVDGEITETGWSLYEIVTYE